MQKMCIDRNHANGIMFIRTSVAKKQQNKADANKEWTVDTQKFATNMRNLILYNIYIQHCWKNAVHRRKKKWMNGGVCQFRLHAYIKFGNSKRRNTNNHTLAKTHNMYSLSSFNVISVSSQIEIKQFVFCTYHSWPQIQTFYYLFIINKGCEQLF